MGLKSEIAECWKQSFSHFLINMSQYRSFVVCESVYSEINKTLFQIPLFALLFLPFQLIIPYYISRKRSHSHLGRTVFITQGARLLWRRSKATNSEEGERGKKGSVTNQFSTGTSFSPASPCKNRKKKKRKKKHTEGFIGMTDPVASKTALFSSRFSMSLSRESRNFHAFRTQRSVKQTHAIFNTDWYTSKSRLHASSRSFARKPAGN